MTKKNIISRSLVLMLLMSFFMALPASGQDSGKILEYLPLYKYKDTPQEALTLLKQNLAQLGITEQQLTVTVLPLQPDKIAAQGTADAINIAKDLMKNIDPTPPPPPPPPAQPKELIQSFNVKYLAPADLWMKLDEVMNNFLNFKRFDTGADNNVTYARGDGSQNRISFYVPDFERAQRDFSNRKQGYMGYRIFIKATNAEQEFVTRILEFILIIDQPIGDKRYEIIPVYYMEIDETIKQLRASGYTAINTAENVDAGLVEAIKSGMSPIIYTAPKVSTLSTKISTQMSGRGDVRIEGSQFKTIEYTDPTATSDVNNLVVYGSSEEIESIRSFVEMLDIPAKQVLIEAQIIEINIDALKDIGLRQVTGKDDMIQSSAQPSFPGESSSTSQDSTATIFTYNDDGAVDIGNFQASIAALVLSGKASIKARPKVTCIDGRQAIITIVRQVPVVQETIIQDTSRFDITFVPVGITLNIKPRIGRGNSEIQMQVNAVVSNVETINNVVTGLNIQAPEFNTREVATIGRTRNHPPLILGGLISSQTEDRTYKVPLLGDLPLIGQLFRRTKEKLDQNEIIIVITPHIANEDSDRVHEEPNEYAVSDPILIPKDSTTFDEFNNIVTNSTYFIKYTDIVGIDPLSRTLIGTDVEKPEIGTINDPVFLTTKRIVNRLHLVEELGITRFIKYPENSEIDDKPLYRQIESEAFLINYIINSNDIRLENLLVGRVLSFPSAPSTEIKHLGQSTSWPGTQIDPEANKDPLYQRIRESLWNMYKDGKVEVVEPKQE
jgi:Flp pilus assembly secretin CpaC